MKVDVVRQCDVVSTPRVVQVSGMFDVPPTEKSRVEIKGDLPIEERDWNIGLIVGPSGAGKTSVARELFPDAMVHGFEWPADRSVLDAFPKECGIKTITGALTAVGFGTVPNWLRPFNVLSNGEQFRATVARALADANDLIVIDEFTSVVDRQVAKIASNSVQKAVRRANRQLIAVSCHYDIVEWLQPDWVFEPHLAAFEWRSLCRRPQLPIEIRSVDKTVWPRFSKYHYLSPRIHPQAICIGGFLGDRCIAFSSAYPFMHPKAKNIYMGSRTVVLPDYQGLSLGGILFDWLGEYMWRHGYRLHASIAHPAVVAYKDKSPRWRRLRTGMMPGGGRNAKPSISRHQSKFSAQRVSTSFEYTPPAGTSSASVPQPLDL